jgi:hypothetical protein
VPAYQISYDRRDIKGRCHAIKFADNEKTAINLLVNRVKKHRVFPTNVTAKQIK